MTDSNSTTPGSLDCRWHLLVMDPLGFERPCREPNALLAGKVILCRMHAKALAKMVGFISRDRAQEIIPNARSHEMETLQRRNRELVLQVQRLLEPPPRAPAPVDGVVYFLRIGGYIKIGWTSNLQRRMREYAPDTLLLATMPGTRKDEKAVHRRFSHLKTHGREWFPLAPQITEYIDTVRSDHGEPPDVEFSARSTSRTVGPRLKQYVGGNNRGSWQSGSVAG